MSKIKSAIKFLFKLLFILLVILAGMLAYDYQKDPSQSRIHRYLNIESASAESVPQETVPTEENQMIESAEEGRTDWELILANKSHPLPEDFTVYTAILPGGESIDSRIQPILLRMLNDMRQQGLYAYVLSGYRSREEQQEILDDKIQSYIDQGFAEEEARQQALEWVNLPGTSEHQTGLAADINADGLNSFGRDVYAWLAAHAWEYGFILRYPEGKSDITGISPEPWHYRYVGLEAAKEIQASGLTLEEYLNAAANSQP